MQKNIETTIYWITNSSNLNFKFASKNDIDFFLIDMYRYHAATFNSKSLGELG